MISRISIKNFALIEHTEIDFNNGLSVLSGETGSGKSIILDALNFALGAKADKSIIRYGSQECSVLAEFSSISKSVKEVLAELDIEAEDEIVVKRKFTLEGKSSIKINGETATVGMLKKITSKLVDVHGQSEHYSLLSETNQLEILDKYCGEKLIVLKEKLVSPIKEIKSITEEIQKLSNLTINGQSRTDLLKYQIQEIENADLKQGEEESLLELKKQINNSEKILSALAEAKAYLSEDSASCDLLSYALKKLSSIAEYSQNYSCLLDEGEEILSSLSDFSCRISDLLEEIDFSQDQANEIEERLDLIKQIHNKYGLTVEDVNDFKERAIIELDSIINGEKIVAQLSNKLSVIEKELENLYKEISAIRQEKAKEFSEKITRELKNLSMQSAEFSIGFSLEDKKLDYNGLDKIEFLFSANKGEPLKSMSKVISGGEMSRLMLALKTEISSLQDIPTYIFDEIDVGISGNVAQTVAERLYNISKNTQIIAISHLPHITAMSDTSYLIYKYEDESKTYSNIKQLDEKGKIEEIVRLIGGSVNSESAVAHATDLLNNAKKIKS